MVGRPKKPKDKAAAVPEVYDVETIEDKRIENGVTKYFIKWRGYPHDQNTWEPDAHLFGCRDLVEEFERALTQKSANMTENVSMAESLNSAEKPAGNSTESVDSACKAAAEGNSAASLEVGDQAQADESYAESNETANKPGTNSAESLDPENEEEADSAGAIDSRDHSTEANSATTMDIGDKEGANTTTSDDSADKEDGNSGENVGIAENIENILENCETAESTEIIPGSVDVDPENMSESDYQSASSTFDSPPLTNGMKNPEKRTVEFVVPIWDEIPEGQIPDEILTVVPVAGGVVYCVKWKLGAQINGEVEGTQGTLEVDMCLIKGDVFKDAFPERIIAFYEKQYHRSARSVRPAAEDSNQSISSSDSYASASDQADGDIPVLEHEASDDSDMEDDTDDSSKLQRDASNNFDANDSSYLEHDASNNSDLEHDGTNGNSELEDDASNSSDLDHDDASYNSDLEHGTTNGNSDLEHGATNGNSDLEHGATNGNSDLEHGATNGNSDLEHGANGNSELEHSVNGNSDLEHVANGNSDLEHSVNGNSDLEHVANGNSDLEHAVNGNSDLEQVTNGNSDLEHAVNGNSDLEHEANTEV